MEGKALNRRIVTYSACARRQLLALYVYIAERSGVRPANDYIMRIERYCQGLDTFPHRGALRDDISPGLRTIGFERRVTIAFRVAPDEVVIAQILYGGQDIEAAFDAE
ncbi:MAG: Toxin ParE1/3/4 [Caulobacter sp.]|nr:Toxin ParE1/3/4 [Caulobacter sp.]